MQFRDLKTQYFHLKPEIDSAILKVVEDSNFIMGKQVSELETMLAEYVGVRHCIACGNGTDALTMALMSWNIKEGDAVFVPDFTFFASGEVVSFEGATPIFVDVEEDTFNMSPSCLESAIQRVIQGGKLVPRAIIAVDLFGLPARFPEILEIAQKYHLHVLEDGAQGFGGMIGSQRACSFGDIATTSFFPAKPLGCYGDGGAVFTNDDAVAEYLRSVCVHGKGSFKYDNVRIGWNSRLDTIQAALLIPKLRAFREFELDAVNRAADSYSARLNDTVIVPHIPCGYFSSWAQYTIRLGSKKQRDRLQAVLKDNGIPSMVYYPKPMRLQRAFQDIEAFQTSCPVTEKLCDTVLSLPMHPYLKTEEIEEVTQVILGFFDRMKDMD